MHADENGPFPKRRRSNRQWALIVLCALLFHAALLLFFRPQYLTFLRRDIPEGQEEWGRFPYLDNPFQVIPTMPANPSSPLHPSIPLDPRETGDEEPADFVIGEPQSDMPPLQRPAGGAGAAGRPAARATTVQPKPLYIPWPTYPRGVKETQGSVELLVLVNERGEVEEVTVAKSLPERELNRIAVDAARRIRFIPGMERGVRASMWVRLSIGFQPR